MTAKENAPSGNEAPSKSRESDTDTAKTVAANLSPQVTPTYGAVRDALTARDPKALTRTLRADLERNHVNIPQELKALKAWVTWRITEIQETDGKFDKVPHYPNGGRRKGEQGCIEDRAQLGTFDDAFAAFKRNTQNAGVGLAMLPGMGYVAFDADKCLDDAGNPPPHIAETVDLTYAESSPSATGIRAFWKGDATNGKDEARGLELYAQKQFVTVTGNVIANAHNLSYSDVPVLTAPMRTHLERMCHSSKGSNTKPSPSTAAGTPEREMVLFDITLETVADVRAALPHLPDDTAEGYGDWIDTGLALKSLSQGGFDAEARELWHEHSQRSDKYDADDCDAKWDNFEPSKVTYKTIFKLAADNGWVNTRSKKAPSRDDLEQARREYQKAENTRIGEGEHTIPTAEVISLETALNRFVFLADGSRVADVFGPHYALALNDWANTIAASTEMVPQPPKTRPDGSKATMPDKEMPVSKLWMNSRHRKSVICLTFKAGGPLMLNDPDGRRALNSYKPFDRSIGVNDTTAADLFLDHVDFLFGADAGRFLDWLAHIEQNPGVLPHTSWLHIAKNFGMGRNWLASVLSRVWAGAVAPNLDLVGVMKSGFNGQLSRKVLAVVDEIREGGRDSQWEHSEKLKSIITEEHRLVNPKYGRQSIEFNACRWLMFSQHLSAIPMESTDRRIEVVATEALPKPPAYYVKLYAALNDPHFIAAVAKVLGTRDISGFNPGAHAKQTESKKAAAKASQTPTAAWCERLLAHWPSDLITTGDLFYILTGCEPSAGASLNAGHRRTLEQFGIVAIGSPKRIGGNMVRLSVIRNKDKWLDADIDAIREELQKALCGLQNARDYLDECSIE